MPSTPKFLDKLFASLEARLEELGITAQVEYQPVPRTKLFRVYVVAENFAEMWHAERQKLVWNAAQEVLSEDQLRRISLILTLTPDEVGDRDEAG